MDIIRNCLLAISVTCLVSCGKLTFHNGNLDVGLAAFKKGDYATAFRELEPLSDDGNPIAQFNLGAMYMEGYGILKDEKLALELYQKSANQGYPNAQYQLAFVHLRDDPIHKDPKKAFDLISNAARQDYAPAETQLCLMHINGIGTAQNSTAAFDWCVKAANQGESYAQLYLGKMYAQGIGVKANKEIADSWLTKSSTQGVGEASFWLGNQIASCNSFKDSPPQKQAEALSLFEKSANQGYSLAQFCLYRLLKSKDLVKSRFWLEKAGDLGLAQAQEALAIYELNPTNGNERNYDLIYKWCEKAAIQNNAFGQYCLGGLYYNGQGVEKNQQLGIQWIRKAASQGQKDALVIISQIDTAAPAPKAEQQTHETSWEDAKIIAKQTCSDQFIEYQLQRICLKNEKDGFDKLKSNFGLPKNVADKAKQRCASHFKAFQLQAVCMKNEKDGYSAINEI